jgi:hypothetical protein
VTSDESDDSIEFRADLQLRAIGPMFSWTLPLPNSGTLTLGRSTRSDVLLEDPLASRDHLRLHPRDRTLVVEDVGSTNGTRVREQPLRKGEQMELSLGETVTIGSTVLTLQERPPDPRRPRFCSNAYFERRVAGECRRADVSGGTVALGRVSLDAEPFFPGAHVRGAVDDADAAGLLAKLAPPNLLRERGSGEFELLIANQSTDEVVELMNRIESAFSGIGAQIRSTVTWYPRDARSVEALLAHATSRPGRALLARACRAIGLSTDRLSDEAAQLLEDHPWTGGVDELKLCLYRALVHCEGQIRPEDLSLNAGVDRDPAER